MDNPGVMIVMKVSGYQRQYILITTIPSLLFAPRLSTTLYASLSCPVNAKKGT